MAEHYVRPPLVPREAPSATLAVWRYRLLAGVLLLVVGLAVLVMFLKFTGATAEDPGFGVGLRAPAATAPAVTAPAVTAPAAL